MIRAPFQSVINVPDPQEGYSAENERQFRSVVARAISAPASSVAAPAIAEYTLNDVLPLRRLVAGSDPLTAGATDEIQVTRVDVVPGPQQIFDASNGASFLFPRGTVPYVLPQWFGFSQDATGAENAAALLAAINSIHKHGGGEIRIPSGDYAVNPVALPFTATTGGPCIFQGVGHSYQSGSVTRLYMTASGNMFTPASGANAYRFKDIEFDGNSTGTRAFYGVYGSQTQFENCLIHQFLTGGVYSRQGLLRIHHCFFIGNGAIDLDMNSDSWVHDCEFSSTAIGIQIVSGGNRITACLINSSSSYGVVIAQGFNNLIMGCYIGENGVNSILIAGTSTGNRNATRNKIIGCMFEQTSTTATGPQIYAKYTRSTMIVACDMIGQADGGGNENGFIKIEDSEDWTISTVLADRVSKNPIILTGATDGQLNGARFRDCGHSSASTAQSYVITGTTAHRNQLANISVTDLRGTGYSRGVKWVSGIGSTLTNYLLSTPVATPNDFGSGADLLTGEGADWWTFTGDFFVSGNIDGGGTLHSDGSITTDAGVQATGDIVSTGGNIAAAGYLETGGDVRMAEGNQITFLVGGVTTYNIIDLDSTVGVKIGGGHGGAFPIVLVGAPAASLPAASASKNGVTLIDTTNNRLVWYSNGNRYYVAGTAF